MINGSKNDVYLNNQAYFYKYTEDYYKLVKLKGLVRQAGWEEEMEDKKIFNFDYHNEDTTDERKCINNSNNTSRARRKIFDYAICNPFEHFVTLTFDRKRIDATNIQTLFDNVRKKLKAYKRKNQDFKYILIPELHSDKKHYHIHGLVSGISPEDLSEHRPMSDGRMRYNWKYWEKYFGFTSLLVLDKQVTRVAKYITKYMTKEISNEFGKDRYIVSRQLKKPQLLLQTQDLDVNNYDYETEYVKIKTYDQYNDFYNDMITQAHGKNQ